jgi:prepilin-type N-terminal cleavage/methylation domain-containing protein
MTRKGFTLLEVLVALSILAISMLGIYSLLNHAVNTTQYSKDRLLLVDKGYERLIFTLRYPRLSQPSEEEYSEDILITYEEEEANTLIPGVTDVILRIKTDDAAASYEYFRKD